MVIPVTTLLVFFTISILLALIPGPDNIFVLTQSAMRGRLSGWVITLGLCTGLVGHTLLVVSGVTVIFQTSYIAFTSLKFAGGIYLLYLAFLAFRSSATTFVPFKNYQTSFLKLYGHGIIMNVTNPKVSIFFISFFTQFSNPSRGSIMPQIIILGFIFIIATLIVFGMISIFAGFLRERMQPSLQAQNIINRIAGTVYVLLSVKLVLTEI